MDLLDDRALASSSVVANARMNRDRGACGVNSYERELRFDVARFLEGRLNAGRQVAWLDLCCGTGKAMIEVAQQLAQHQDGTLLHGVDLVPMFHPVSPGFDCVRFEVASLHPWKPARTYDLVTCVHGLHYLGDKLGLIAKAVSCLVADGEFRANLDLANFRSRDGLAMSRPIAKYFRESGLNYDRRTHLLSCSGRKEIASRFRYLGANDQPGPNYSGQEAVDSYYKPVK